MKKKTAVWIAGVAAAALLVWFWGTYHTVRTIVAAGSQARSATTVFPAPEFTTYQMDLQLDPIKYELLGRSLITTKNTTGGDLDCLWFTTYPNAMRDRAATPAPASAYYSGFDPGNLEILAAEVNGEIAKVPVQDVSSRIDLPAAVKGGDDITIDLTWKVKIPRAAYRLGGKDRVILLGNFYPQLNIKDKKGWHLCDNTRFGDPFFAEVANYSVSVRLPEAYQVASSGKVIDVRAEDNGWQTLMISAPQVRDFAMAATFFFEQEMIPVNGVQVEGYFDPAVPKAIRDDVMERAAAALQYYNAAYGSYNYSRFVAVQGSMQGFQGMEYSGLIFLSDDVFSPAFGDDRRGFLVAHEVAHQWWYGMVGNDQLKEPWLDEGLATWSARQYLSSVEFRENESRAAFTKGQLDKELDQMESKSSYLNAAYKGGEAFWNQLVREIGEEKVQSVLRSYLASYKYKTANFKDLRKVIEEESRNPLDGSFSIWF